MLLFNPLNAVFHGHEADPEVDCVAGGVVQIGEQEHRLVAARLEHVLG